MTGDRDFLFAFTCLKILSWLDAHTNIVLLLFDVKDHLNVRACHDGGGEWFIPWSSELSWSQSKQLQLSWCILSVCVYVSWRRMREKREILLSDWAGTWVWCICVQGLWFLSQANSNDSVLAGPELPWDSLGAGHGTCSDNDALRAAVQAKHCSTAMWLSKTSEARVRNLTCNF